MVDKAWHPLTVLLHFSPVHHADHSRRTPAPGPLLMPLSTCSAVLACSLTSSVWVLLTFLSVPAGCLSAVHTYSQIYCRLTDVSPTRTWAPGGKGSFFCIWGYLWYPQH